MDLKEKIVPDMGHIQNYMLSGFATTHIQALFTFTARVTFFVRGTVDLFNAIFKQHSDHFKLYETHDKQKV